MILSRANIQWGLMLWFRSTLFTWRRIGQSITKTYRQTQRQTDNSSINKQLHMYYGYASTSTSIHTFVERKTGLTPAGVCLHCVWWLQISEISPYIMSLWKQHFPEKKERQPFIKSHAFWKIQV
jgi:hypothetical protein